MSHKMETRLICFKEMKPLCKRLLYYILYFVNFSEKIMRIHMLMSLGFLPGHRNVVFGDLNAVLFQGLCLRSSPSRCKKNRDLVEFN